MREIIFSNFASSEPLRRGFTVLVPNFQAKLHGKCKSRMNLLAVKSGRVIVVLIRFIVTNANIDLLAVKSGTVVVAATETLYS